MELILTVTAEVCSDEDVTPLQLRKLEHYLDDLFRYVGIDVDLGKKHFLDRVNDSRNKKQITVCELRDLFREVFKKYGKSLEQKSKGFQGVFTDLSTKLNIPFVLVWDAKNKEIDLVAKTVMRKPNFKTSNPKFKITS